MAEEGFKMKNKIMALVEDYLEYKHSLGFQLKGEAVYLMVEHIIPVMCCRT